MATEISGLREFRAALRASLAEAPAALEATHKELADKGAGFAREKARGMGGIQARAASAIGARGDESSARIAVLPSAGGRDKMANVAFWGALRHTGWYANPRYENSTRQHPPWVGNDWDIAVAGEGPYAINDALAEHRDELLDLYMKMLDELTAPAFPDESGIPSGRSLARGADGINIRF